MHRAAHATAQPTSRIRCPLCLRLPRSPPPHAARSQGSDAIGELSHRLLLWRSAHPRGPPPHATGWCRCDLLTGTLPAPQKRSPGTAPRVHCPSSRLSPRGGPCCPRQHSRCACFDSASHQIQRVRHPTHVRYAPRAQQGMWAHWCCPRHCHYWTAPKGGRTGHRYQRPIAGRRSTCNVERAVGWQSQGQCISPVAKGP
jgi:hypothetical protein